MRGYLSTSYGDSFTTDFEALHARHLPDPGPMVETLANLAGEGPALELGIGSGRVARPLAEKGIAVDGIEVSTVMIEQLRRSTEGLPVHVSQGSFADTSPPQRYQLVYCVWGTFFYLTSRAEQQRAFENIARALRPDGVLVLEVFVPDPGRFHQGQEIKIHDITADSVSIQFARHRPEDQIIESQRVVISHKQIDMHPVVARYAPCDELDELARNAGLELRERWADWTGQEFTERSTAHVSTYRLATG